MATNDDVTIAAADVSVIPHVVSTWIPEVLVRKAKERDFSYRYFPWDVIIQHPAYCCLAATGPGGRVEGLLALLDTGAEMKVAFVSSAPWNYGRGKGRRGIGAALIAVAVEISRQRGYGGRVVLSSTPESEKFYERIGFRRTGATDGEGLAVFHLPAASVTRFLKSYPPLKAA